MLQRCTWAYHHMPARHRSSLERVAVAAREQQGPAPEKRCGRGVEPWHAHKLAPLRLHVSTRITPLTSFPSRSMWQYETWWQKFRWTH